MTTDIIDPLLHKSSFPTTYIGPGTVVGNPRFSPDADLLTGYFTSDGNATQIDVGFEAQVIEVTNVTDGIVTKWQRGMPAGDTIKTTLGGSFASVIDTNGLITVTTVDGRSSILLSATEDGSGKLILYSVIG